MQLYTYNGRITTYFITTEGKCFNEKTQKWLKGQINKNGYLTYYLSIDGDKVRKYAHRMVMETYSFDPSKEKKEINHKDGNKLNNNIENLEWASSSENKIHAIKNDLRSVKKIYCFNDRKELIAEYHDARAIYEIFHYSINSLQLACSLEEKTLYKGFYWSYSKENDFRVRKNINSGKSKKVGKFLLDGSLLEIYNSCAEAARKNAYVRTRISECCNNKHKTYKGFIWKFIIDDIV